MVSGRGHTPQAIEVDIAEIEKALLHEVIENQLLGGVAAEKDCDGGERDDADNNEDAKDKLLLMKKLSSPPIGIIPAFWKQSQRYKAGVYAGWACYI